jgi:ABC-2 type transport system ATP-binding protein
MLTWDGITKKFSSDLLTTPFVALDNVSFSVPDGSMVGFIGANGAGKTTCLKIALDFIRPTSGVVSFSPRLGKTRQEIFKNIGFLPERPYYYPHLRGEDFIFFMGELSGLSRTKMKSQLPSLAQRFRLDHALHRELKTYSKGMLQRIGFLVTVLHAPQLIILDEPLSGLDPVGRKEMKDIIVEIHREGKTVFFSSHIVSDVEEVCDRVVFLRHGKLIHDGPVQPLLQAHARPAWRVSILKSTQEIVCPILSRTSLGGGVDAMEVASDLKDKLVQELCSKGFSIVNLEQIKPHLEEIFYQTGKG